MCYMYYEHISENDMLAKFNDAVPPYTGACFFYYYKKYNGVPVDGLKMYFGFYSSPKIELLIEELNKKFTNIKIVVDYNKKFPFNGDKDYIKSKEQPFYVFHVELDEKYSDKAKSVLTLVMAQFVRITCPEYNHFVVLKNLGKTHQGLENLDTIEKTILAFNKSGGSYGTIVGSMELSPEVFYKVDNIELANKAASTMNIQEFIRASAFFKNLKESK